MRRTFIVTAFAATIALAGPAGAATNYLTNGSFETGDLTGWNQTAIVGYTGVLRFPEDGSYGAFFGAEGQDSVISQTFSDVAGETLTIHGWISADGNMPSDVGFYFNGTPVVYLNPVTAMGYTQYSATVTATGIDTFAVGARNDPGLVWVDNVSVSPAISAASTVAAAVPEASTWAMMLAGFVGLGFASYRKAARISSAAA
jgi:hypothetical protein